MIPEYKILAAPDTGTLELEVNIAMQAGWRPLGAPFFIGSGLLTGSLRMYGGIAQAATRTPPAPLPDKPSILIPPPGPYDNVSKPAPKMPRPKTGAAK